MPIVDPTYCKRKILDIHGEYGTRWLAELPARVAECAERWALELLPPFPIESYSYVAPAVRSDGEPVVLKVGVPGRELTCQIEALRHWNGSGICRLLEADAAAGFLLMERVLPGEPLKTVASEEQVTGIALDVMRQLWKPAPEQHDFPTIAEWAGDLQKLRFSFDGGCGPFPAVLIERAERQFAELLSDGPLMLIHGDMNWGNILRAQREPWLVIDPKGVVGHPLYDTATFLNDPPEGLTRPELKRLLARRVAQIAEGLGVERTRVKSWAQAHCVLAGYWIYEDHHGQGWEDAFAMAEVYDEVT
ncbi:MAG: aminoglycoside resistance protein [Chloroflexota bacterium]|nr:MAG: aminoglycoside resistance protein [Chloroflexota bacterium]